MKIKKQIKKIVIMAAGMLIFPVFVFAAEWGICVLPDGSTSFSLGSSPAAGAGCGAGGLGTWSTNPAEGVLPAGSIYMIVYNIMFWLLAIFAIVGIIGFVLAGLMYLLAAGDENMITRAKTAMSWSIIGVIVGLSGYLIMEAVKKMLSAQVGF